MRFIPDPHMKRIIVSVTNDLTTDQRVDRVCKTLIDMGFDVLLVGRKLKNSLVLKGRNYKTKRLRLVFRKGPLFYAEYNIRLFFFLLYHKSDLFLSNDLDTLLANWLISVIRHLPLVHDCHEYFRGVPELNGRPGTTKIWKMIEDLIFPGLRDVYAVNESIARIYHNEYGNDVKVIRNFPFRKNGKTGKTKKELGIPEDRLVILYQGAVNVDRGLDEAIDAMKFVKTNATLLIIGTGDILEKLKKQVIEKDLSDKVIFTGQIPLEELSSYTMIADIGLSIEKDVSLNYHFCLPNKFLDYIQSNVPVLISPLIEMKTIVEQYNIGAMIASHDPAYLAEKMDNMLNDQAKLAFYRENLKIAASELCWENEQQELIRIFQDYV
jgi:glycosyltransferase involved in cell wall biosynthesis